MGSYDVVIHITREGTRVLASTSDSLEVNFVRWSAAAVVEFAKDPSERLASVVYRSVTPRPRHHHLARLEHQRRRLGLVLINQTDDLRMPRRNNCPEVAESVQQVEAE